MVLKASNRCKTLGKGGNWLFIILLFIFVIFMTMTVAVLCFGKDDKSVSEEPSNNEAEIVIEEPIVEEPILPDAIDFQDLVDEWASSVGGNRSVLIYDLDREEIAGEYNSDESYNTASLYKLFVVYEGYRKVQSGDWDGEDATGGTGFTILECLDLAIRESHSECAETLWSMIGRENLTGVIMNEFDITNSNINNLISNPHDIMKMMRLFYLHEDITDEALVAQIQDSFLNQPATTYDWRQGLPSGFSQANVYNKVGWDFNPDGNYWNIYHDAAIVEFSEDRHFIVVVMTNRVPFQKITDLGRQIEEYYYNNQ